MTRFIPTLVASLALLAAGVGCTATSHGAVPSTLGRAATTAELLQSLSDPGPLEVETVLSADWVVARGGLINLEHPRAQDAGLTRGEEPIHIAFHVLRHPTHGTFVIDTGAERALRDAPKEAAVRGLVAGVMKTERMVVREPLGDWLAREEAPPSGVFLTHLHLDHVTGLPDVPRHVPVHTGPGEASARGLQNLFTRGTMNRALKGMGPVQEWPFGASDGAAPELDASLAFDGVVDVFGDGSLWAIWVPGHTVGSTAYLARTPEGPVLFVGDACHTRWGWDNAVEPGTFSEDKPRSAQSLGRLRALVERHPQMRVRLGHQH